jgi:hypothetical protein
LSEPGELVNVSLLTFASHYQWHTFIIFAIFCCCWVPVVYCFFPETSQLQLEDIDHLFEKQGVTGGVFTSKGGRTVEPGYHARVPNLDRVVKSGLDGVVAIESV